VPAITGERPASRKGAARNGICPAARNVGAGDANPGVAGLEARATAGKEERWMVSVDDACSSGAWLASST
jgi:hypothetical protein